MSEDRRSYLRRKYRGPSNRHSQLMKPANLLQDCEDSQEQALVLGFICQYLDFGIRRHQPNELNATNSNDLTIRDTLYAVPHLLYIPTAREIIWDWVLETTRRWSPRENDEMDQEQVEWVQATLRTTIFDLFPIEWNDDKCCWIFSKTLELLEDEQLSWTVYSAYPILQDNEEFPGMDPWRQFREDVKKANAWRQQRGWPTISVDYREARAQFEDWGIDVPDEAE